MLDSWEGSKRNKKAEAKPRSYKQANPWEQIFGAESAAARVVFVKPVGKTREIGAINKLSMWT